MLHYPLTDRQGFDIQSCYHWWLQWMLLPRSDGSQICKMSIVRQQIWLQPNHRNGDAESNMLCDQHSREAWLPVFPGFGKCLFCLLGRLLWFSVLQNRSYDIGDEDGVGSDYSCYSCVARVAWERENDEFAVVVRGDLWHTIPYIFFGYEVRGYWDNCKRHAECYKLCQHSPVPLVSLPFCGQQISLTCVQSLLWHWRQRPDCSWRPRAKRMSQSEWSRRVEIIRDTL